MAQRTYLRARADARDTKRRTLELIDVGVLAVLARDDRPGCKLEERAPAAYQRRGEAMYRPTSLYASWPFARPAMRASVSASVSNYPSRAFKGVGLDRET